MSSNLEAALLAEGFVADETSRDAVQQNAEAQNMSLNGAYLVLNVYVRNDVLVTIEKNESPEDLGGYTAIIQHPALAIVTSPKGRVAVNPTDVDLVLSVVSDLS